jgi:hypothetical protein
MTANFNMSALASLLGTLRTATYIAFDGDSDLMSYRTIQSWNQDIKTPFSIEDAHELNNAWDDSLPESIQKQLKIRLDRSKNMLLIIGDQTNKNRKGILQYEINYALRNNLPIFLVYKSYSSILHENTEKLWKNELEPKIPKFLREAQSKYCLVSPFTRDILIQGIHHYYIYNLPKLGYTWHWR